MDLLNSAKIFLIESLNNFIQSSGAQSERSILFSILHATVAVELLLKERLRRFDESLIFITNKNGNINFDKTIGIDTLPSALRAQGVELGENKNLIKTIATWRNYIVHYVPVHDSKAKIELERLYDFVYFFLVNHLKEDICVFLPKNYYQKMEKIIAELRTVINAAKIKASLRGLQDEQNYCPSCCLVGVIENCKVGAYCYLCELKLVLTLCPSCEEGSYGYSSIDKSFGHMWQCRKCDERAEQIHTDYLIDSRRGK